VYASFSMERQPVGQEDGRADQHGDMAQPPYKLWSLMIRPWDQRKKSVRILACRREFFPLCRIIIVVVLFAWRAVLSARIPNSQLSFFQIPPPTVLFSAFRVNAWRFLLLLPPSPCGEADDLQKTHRDKGNDSLARHLLIQN